MVDYWKGGWKMSFPSKGELFIWIVLAIWAIAIGAGFALQRISLMQGV